MRPIKEKSNIDENLVEKMEKVNTLDGIGAKPIIFFYYKC